MTEFASPPDKLYRGIVVPVDQLDSPFLQSDLLPGSKAKLDEQGRPTVLDGNEYGVYMSDNEHMVETAYATPRHGQPLPVSPVFRLRSAQSTVDIPRVGVMHEISTDGLGARKPFITSQLRGVYNNGFEGNEWIADVVPAENHTVKKLKLGSDILHAQEDFEVSGNLDEAVARLKATTAKRIAKLHVAASLIRDMPGNSRHVPGFVERTLSKHPDFESHFARK